MSKKQTAPGDSERSVVVLPMPRAARAFVAAVLLSINPCHAEPQAAQDILKSVRLSQVQQERTLKGQLRSDELKIPFTLQLEGSVTRYVFANPPLTLQLQLGEQESQLEEITRSGTKEITYARDDEKIRGTDISYGDLSLNFLYWRKASVEGEETLRTRRCWKVKVVAPTKQSQYATVLLWIDQGSGALMRADGYDWNGAPVKRFEVVSGQKIDGAWFLKQMRITRYVTGTWNTASRTYLEIDGLE